jgi:hypothetical protein
LDPDGRPVYVSEQEALFNGIGFCLLWAIDHPAEVTRGLALAALAAASLYFVYDVINPTQRPAARRQR